MTFRDCGSLFFTSPKLLKAALLPDALHPSPEGGTTCVVHIYLARDSPALHAESPSDKYNVPSKCLASLSHHHIHKSVCGWCRC